MTKIVVKLTPRSEPEPPPVISPPNQLWRVRHDYEIFVKGITCAGHGQINAAAADKRFRLGLPEVFWLYQVNADGKIDDKEVPFGERWQWLSYQMNSQIQPLKWQELHNDWIAFHNKGAGFPHPNIPGTVGYDKTYIPTPRHDYINKMWTDAPDPVWDKVRVCGGATVSGKQDGNYVDIDALDANNPPDNVQYILSRPWLYFRAVSKVRADALSGAIVDFPQNGSYPSLIPLVANTRVRLPVVLLEKVDAIFDPYQVVV